MIPALADDYHIKLQQTPPWTFYADVMEAAQLCASQVTGGQCRSMCLAVLLRHKDLLPLAAAGQYDRFKSTESPPATCVPSPSADVAAQGLTAHDPNLHGQTSIDEYGGIRAGARSRTCWSRSVLAISEDGAA